MLDLQASIVVAVDVQARLADAMHERDRLLDRMTRFLRGAAALGAPMLWTEQLPDKLGPTREEIRQTLPPGSPIVKASFSCCGSDVFLAALKDAARRQVVLCGIETHVCVLQTALDLLELGYEVAIVEDATSSRSAADRAGALRRMERAGAEVLCVESALYEWMRTAEHPAFREILKLVK
jgi:isochorismate hydrolase